MPGRIRSVQMVKSSLASNDSRRYGCGAPVSSSTTSGSKTARITAWHDTAHCVVAGFHPSEVSASTPKVSVPP